MNCTDSIWARIQAAVECHETKLMSLHSRVLGTLSWPLLCENRVPPTGLRGLSWSRARPSLKNVHAHSCAARPEISKINIKGRPNAVSHSEPHFRDTEAGFNWHSSPWGSSIFRARHDFPSHTYKHWKIHSNYHAKSHSSIAPTQWWGVQVAT